MPLNCFPLVSIELKSQFRFYRELGESISDEDLRSMINEFDGDRDGESEFGILLLKSI